MGALTSQFEKFKSKMIDRFDRAGVVLESQMIVTVAQKTRTLERSIRKDPVKTSGNEISVEVGSEGVPYAGLVERGVKGRVYQYHRLKGAGRAVVWVGVGMEWAKRSLEAKRAEILSIIKYGI